MAPTLRRAAVLSVALLAGATLAPAADPAPKKLLLVTHSGGFVHPSVASAEDALKEVGPKNGFDVTCFRYTGDTSDVQQFEKYAAKFRKDTGKTVEAENCGRINKDTLKKFDAVLFFTTGNPMTKDELGEFTEWLNAGGALVGTHCATDTLYNTPFGEIIGGYFKSHPPGLQKVKLKVEDPKHPAAAPFANGEEITDEIYIFRDAPYSRDNLHVILSVAPDSEFPPARAANQARPDGDYAISWCKEQGKGKVFYTSLGHPKDTWKDPKFQEHLFNGIKWATGQLPGDATPSAKLGGNSK